MKFLKIFILFGSICLSSAYAQVELDSLNNLINAKKGSEKVKIINEIARIYVDKDLFIAERLSEEAFHLAENINDNHGKADAAASLGLINYLKGQFNQAEYYCRIAKEIAFILKNENLERDVNTTLALVYEEQGKNKNSLELFTRNAIIDRKLADSLRLAVDYQNIADIKFNLDTTSEALYYYRLAEKIYEEKNIRDRLVKVYDHIGKIYLEKNLDSAQIFFSKSFNIYNELQGLNGYYDIFWNLSDFFMRKSLPDSSLHYLQLGRVKAEQEGNNNMLLKSYQLLSGVFEKTGQYSDAYNFQKKYSFLKDSIDTVGYQASVNDHIHKLENENKEQTLELLRKEAQLKNGQWLTEDIVYYLLFGGVFLVAFIFIAFFARYRLYKKSIASTDKLKQDIVTLTTELTKKDSLISEIKKRENRLIQKNRVLGSFVNPYRIREPEKPNTLSQELKSFLSAIKADVAGLMLYNEFRQFVILGEYNLKEEKFSKDAVLTNNFYPLYFEAIKTENMIVSDDCRTDPRYAEFLENRFNSEVKVRRVDFPVKIEQKFLGMIFVERHNSNQSWTEPDFEILEEKSDLFIPILVKGIQDRYRNEECHTYDLIAIQSVFRDFQALILEKSENGYIYRSFPEKVEFPQFHLENLSSNNWFNFIDISLKENLEGFYQSLKPGEYSGEDQSMSYNIFDPEVNTLQVKEIIRSVADIDNEKRIKSVIYFELSVDTVNDLRTQANSFKAVIASLMHGLIVTDEKGKILMANPISGQISGYSAEELNSMTLPSLMEKSIEIFGKNTSAKKPQLVTLKKKSGDSIPCNLLFNKFQIKNKKYYSIEFYVRGYKNLASETLSNKLKTQKSNSNLFNDKPFLIYLTRFYIFLFKKDVADEIKILDDLEKQLTNDPGPDDSAVDFDRVREAVEAASGALIDPTTQYDLPTINGMLKPGLIQEYHVDYGINFIGDKLNTINKGRVIFHREAGYNRTLRCDLALLIFSAYHLILNSMESIKKEGDLYIKTSFQDNKFIFIITDTGEGILPEVRKKLFLAPVSTKENHHGNGLYYIKKIIGSMGGEVHIRSQLNKGTEVIIEIPAVL